MPPRQCFPVLRSAQRSESPKLFCRDTSTGNSKVLAEYVLTPEQQIR